MRKAALLLAGLVGALAAYAPSTAQAGDLGTVTDASRGIAYVSEMRLGVFVHDVDGNGQRREDGIDINGELLFGRPGFQIENTLLHFLLTPRPMVGFNVNSDNDTHTAYAGLTWDLYLWGPLFAEASFGGVVHTGNTGNTSLDAEALGCRVLFRESAGLGIDVTENVRLLAHVEHMSNAGLCDFNGGITNVGLRVGYRF
jgi:lipid A 3-O-deacylase